MHISSSIGLKWIVLDNLPSVEINRRDAVVFGCIRLKEVLDHVQG